MWDARYQTKDYVYGTHANDFLRTYSHHIPRGNVLSLAEGEGRNAVYLAQQGYTVTAVDASRVGLDKAQALADRHGVHIECIHADLAEYDLGINQWDGIVSIFCPLPSPLRRRVHQQAAQGLKANGVFLLEAYTPAQIHHGTGGGDDTDTMQTAHTLQKEFGDPSLGIQFEHLVEQERNVVEGIYHTGMSAVVQMVGRKCLTTSR